MRYPSGIPALLTWSICLLQLVAAAGSISRPRDHDLRQVLSADYDKVKARVNDLKRIFGLEEWPYLKNLSGDKHLYDKGIKLIPGILEAYEDLYVDRCPNPITREEARIWAKHRAFVLDAYLAWSRGDSTGKPFPYDKVDAFFQQFRDIYDVMPNPEMFHVKSLNITELDMGSAEASFEALFDKMEDENFDGPINAAEVHRCYWRQLIFDNKFDITAIWPQVQKMGPEWMTLSIISFISHNHTTDDLHELWGEVAELQWSTRSNQQQYIDHSLENAWPVVHLETFRAEYLAARISGGTDQTTVMKKAVQNAARKMSAMVLHWAIQATIVSTNQPLSVYSKYSNCASRHGEDGLQFLISRRTYTYEYHAKNGADRANYHELLGNRSELTNPRGKPQRIIKDVLLGYEMYGDLDASMVEVDNRLNKQTNISENHRQCFAVSKAHAGWMRYSTGISALPIWICLLAVGSSITVHRFGFRHKLPADVERARARIRDVRKIFGLQGSGYGWVQVGGDERLYEKGVNLIPDIVRIHQEFYVNRCPDPIPQEEAKIWVSQRAFVLDAYLEWERGNLTGKPFPYEEVDAFFRQFRDIYESMLTPELFDVKSLNITELNKGSANASFEGLFEQIETQHGPLDETAFNGCYWTQHILDSNFCRSGTWPELNKLLIDQYALQRATFIYKNHTGIERGDWLDEVPSDLWAIFEHLSYLSDRSLANAWPFLHQEIFRAEYLIAKLSGNTDQSAILKDVVSKTTTKIRSMSASGPQLFQATIIASNHPVYVYNKSQECSSRHGEDGLQFLISQRQYKFFDNATIDIDDIRGNRLALTHPDGEAQKIVRDVFGGYETSGDMEASMEEIHSRLNKQTNISENHHQCFAVSKAHAGWMRYPSGIPALLTWSICLLQLAAAAGSISRPRDHDLRQVLSADYDKVKARENDLKRIFGLDDWPHTVNLSGGDERLYEKGIKLIPGILEAYEELFVDRCRDPITKEEAKIWAEHRGFVLDAFLAWDRRNSTGKPFPYGEVDAFFQEFRDIYDVMPNPELFDVKSLNIPELDMGSAEASFEVLFDKMEDENFHGPINATAVYRCYWRQLIFDNNFAATDIWPHLQKMGPDVGLLSAVTHLYHNHTGKDPEALMTPVYELQMMTMMLLQRNMAHTFENAWPVVHQEAFRAEYLAARMSGAADQTAIMKKAVLNAARKISSMTTHWAIQATIVSTNQPLSVYSKYSNCSSRHGEDGLQFLISRRTYTHDFNNNTYMVNYHELQGNRSELMNPRGKPQRIIKDVLLGYETYGDLDASMVEVDKRLDKQTNISENHRQCFAVSKAHAGWYSGSCPIAPTIIQSQFPRRYSQKTLVAVSKPSQFRSDYNECYDFLFF